LVAIGCRHGLSELQRHVQISPRPASSDIAEVMDTPVPRVPEQAETEDERRVRLAWEARALDKAEAEAEWEGWIEGDEILAWMRSWGTENELPPPEPRK
jgi:predicted transcriptional regulator